MAVAENARTHDSCIQKLDEMTVTVEKSVTRQWQLNPRSHDRGMKNQKIQ